MPDNQQNPKETRGTSAGGAAGSSDDSGQLQGHLEAANKQIAELTETAKRALADLQNYRRRVEEERAAFVQFANVTLILELLPILDNFQRAFAQVPEEISNRPSLSEAKQLMPRPSEASVGATLSDWFKGALAIEQQLVGVVKKQGVTEMPSQIGKKLDPKIHEAIASGAGEKDVIIEEFEKGYLLGEKVIRPAKVKVGDGTGN